MSPGEGCTVGGGDRVWQWSTAPTPYKQGAAAVNGAENQLCWSEAQLLPLYTFTTGVGCVSSQVGDPATSG
ncbi:hypothetical protein GCM10020219_032460 [Nonomuraea dietziae]